MYQLDLDNNKFLYKKEIIPEKVDLEKFITVVCQEAYKVEGNTTINTMLSWMLKEILPPICEDFQEQINTLVEHIEHLQSQLDEVAELRNINKAIQTEDELKEFM